MKKKIMFVILLILAVVFKDTIAAAMRIGGIQPDLLLFFVVFIAIFKGPVWGSIAGLLIGLGEDVLISRYIGLNLLAKMAAGYCAGKIVVHFYKDNYLIPVMSMGLASLIAGLVFISVGTLVGINLDFWHYLGFVVVPQTVYNCVLTPLVYIFAYLFFYEEKESFL